MPDTPPPDFAARPESVQVAPGFSLDQVCPWLAAVIRSELDAVIVIDANGKIALCNAETALMFGYAAEQIVGNPVGRLFPEPIRDEQQAQMNSFATARVTGRRLRIKLDLQGVRANGEEFLLNAAVSRISVDQRVCLAVILRELVHHAPHHPHQVLAQSARRKLALSSQQAYESERRRFSRELYDDLGQSLSVLKLDLDWLQAGVHPDRNTVERIARMQYLLDNVILRTKDIASTLRPTLLDDFGLTAAVEWIAGVFEKKTGVKCNFINNGVPAMLDKQVESAVFRVLQESLLNTERHAKPSRVTIRLWHTDQHLHCEIEDDGGGLRSDSWDKADCHGLSMMQERVYALGGVLNIHNNDLQGVTVHASIPLLS